MAPTPSFANHDAENLVGIFSFTGAENYGSVLQNYALGKVINDLGYKCEHINVIGRRDRNSPFYEFRKKYLNMTEPVFNFTHAELLNDRYKIIVTGSDQVWNDIYSEPALGMLAWASGEKTLISYAASFGEEELLANIHEDVARSMLERLDAISVREDTAVNICGKLGLRAEHVLDPSLLLDVADYQKIIDDSKDDLSVPEKYVLLYDVQIFPDEIIGKIKEKFKKADINVISFNSHINVSGTPAQFLNAIKNAKCIITNSFHGICFSIRFNKNFYIIRQPVDCARMESLLRILNIKRKSYSFQEIDPDILTNEEDIDYKNVNARLADLKIKSLSYLKNSLAIQPSYKKNYIDKLLTDKKAIAWDEHGSPAAIRKNMSIWADSLKFNPAMTQPFVDTLRVACDIMLGKLFYAYETEDKSLLAERELALELLYADAKRLVDEKEYDEICNDHVYKTDPHKLHARLWNIIKEKHYNWFVKQIKNILANPFYILFGRYGDQIFDSINSKIRIPLPQAYVCEYHVWEGEDNGIPQINFYNFLKMPIDYPVIIFSSKHMGLIKKIHLSHPDCHVIPCVFG